MPKDITVIMPALNEQDNIKPAVARTMEAFGRFSLEGEIIVVNDGSRDKTADTLRQLQAEYKDALRLLEHRTAQGIGACFKDALKQARGEAVVLLPGDNENDPNEIIRYTGLLKNVDMVVPFIYNKKEARGPIRNMLSAAFIFVINRTFGQSFKYTNGTTLYRRSIIADIDYKNRGFFFQAELLVKAARRGYLYAEVPCRLDRRQKGRSKAVSFSSFFKVTKGYLSLIKDIYFSKQDRPLATDSLTHKRMHSL